MKQPKIISFGEVLWDLFPTGARFGGAPANFACHAADLEGKVTMVSAIGTDERGREALTILNSFGINTQLVQVKEAFPTGTVGVELDEAGKPAFTIHEASAWDHLEWRPEIESEIASADALYFGTLGQRTPCSRTTIQRAVGLACERGIPRVLDVNLRAPFFNDTLIRESIAAASVLKLSDDELDAITTACGVEETNSPEEALRRLLDQGELDIVVLTRGAEGALLVSRDSVINQPGLPTKVRDTVGAGDSFTAALILGVLRGEDYAVMLHNACARASEVCAMPGAVPASLTI